MMADLTKSNDPISTEDRRHGEADPLAELYGRMRGGYAQSQATVIEETRAATQVVASIMAAKRWPRDEVLAAQKMRLAADRIELADQAFWSFPRGKDTLEGMTVQMARALLAIWGNAVAGIQELHHDTKAQTTEMRAYATDLETNVSFDRIFTVHWRIESGGRQKTLVTDREIYENNANLGSRRLRQCIFDLLPGWYTTEAGEIARKRLENPDPTKSPAQLAADAISWLEGKGISLPRIEMRLRKPRANWNGYDLAQLRVLMGTLHRHEGTADELFPDAPVTSEEVLGARSGSAASTSAPSTGASPAAEPQGDAEPARKARHPGRPELDIEP
jgi:hypothetical protein